MKKSAASSSDAGRTTQNPEKGFATDDINLLIQSVERNNNLLPGYKHILIHKIKQLQANGETPTLEDTVNHINFLDASSYGTITTKEMVEEIFKYLKKDNPIRLSDKNFLDTTFENFIKDRDSLTKEEEQGAKQFYLLLRQGSYKELNDFYNNPSQVKDNPVPSLDRELLQQIQYMCFDKTKEIVDIALFIDELLQNGVETDNEQPKCNCKHAESCDNSCLS